MALPNQRTATRMLPSSSIDSPGPASPRGAATTHPQQPPSTAAQPSPGSTGRRKSLCFPLSASDAGPGDDTAGGGEGAAGHAGADSSPPHLLSVPLTLLSLHNGGHSRHVPRERSSRDTSPGLGLLAREGSIGFGESAPAVDWSAGSSGASGGGAAAAGGASPTLVLGGGLLGGRRRTEMEGASPTPRLGAGMSGLASPSVPAAASPLRDSTSIWCTPAAVSSAAADLPAALSAPSCAAAAAIDASGLVPQSVVLAAAAASAAAAGGGGSPVGSGSGGGASPGAGGVGGSGGGGGGLHVTLPAHLCSLRPPTPLSKDEELMAAAVAAHSYASPTRRRSRFASSADPGLLLAAQAAVAADEAGLLESPPGSYSGTGGTWPDHGGGGRHGRRGAASTSSSGAAPGPVALSFTAGAGAGAGGSGGGAGTSELPFARPLLGVGLEPAPWSSPGRSTSRRAGPSALGTVPEDSLIPHSRGDAFPSRPSALGASGSGPASPALNAMGNSGSSHAGGAGGGPSPAAAPPGVSPSSLTARRQRLSTPQVPDLDAGGLTGSRAPSMTAGHGAAAALGASGQRPGAGAITDDSLSSFMHSFGPNSSAAAAAARVASGVCSPAGGR
ncbi:hypothetical protein HYH02_005192 [Chlamydomonas schloesseri]|uniref:Uncharacterized protein n=1 Tax=Chlamydomonas schloesseri TaxID=2026947 RepID=A0A836B762_9CHLO|nr:hypothetical protein HYH02_005192 [Chlamydomonas schloesseri]|eukprot:KAG2449662.1 hypothetical protein HYH02_005192 [Chlamydomonas schloesseri]